MAAMDPESPFADVDDQPFDPAAAVYVEYRTADERNGRAYGVPSVKDAIQHHPDAVIVGYQNGQPFTGKASRQAIRQARAELRDAGHTLKGDDPEEPADESPTPAEQQAAADAARANVDATLTATEATRDF